LCPIKFALPSEKNLIADTRGKSAFKILTESRIHGSELEAKQSAALYFELTN
jgi:hypothetical protein